jgi:hypothetical protein
MTTPKTSSRRGNPLEDEMKARPRRQPSTSLLRLLATAQDAVSRFDALASAAPASVRAGVVAPDLALRAAGVLGSFAGQGRGSRDA